MRSSAVGSSASSTSSTASRAISTRVIIAIRGMGGAWTGCPGSSTERAAGNRRQAAGVSAGFAGVVGVGLGRVPLSHRLLSTRRAGGHHTRALARVLALGGGPRQPFRVLLLQLRRGADSDGIARGSL